MKKKGFSQRKFSWRAVLKAMPLVSNLIVMDRRNGKDDVLCVVNFWRKWDHVNIPESVFYDIVNNATNPEIIRRARQKLGEQKRKAYGVTSEVERKRLELAEKTRVQAKQKTLY